MAIKTIGLMFFMCRKYVVVPRRFSEDPDEHILGNYRITILEMISMERNRRQKTKAMLESRLKIIETRQIKKEIKEN